MMSQSRKKSIYRSKANENKTNRCYNNLL
ncbi:hypothetical protein LINGRAHAP2_LOCUS25001 [Linum grandiflorum]